MMPVLNIGPLAVQLAGLIWLFGAWLGLALAEKHAPRRGIDGNDLYHLVLFALVGGVIGARLAYVLRFPAAFAGSPWSLVSPNPGLLDPFGGAAAALLIGLIFAQRKGLALWPTLDALTPAAAVLAVAAAGAHLAAGTAFGAPSELPWSVFLWGANRHPSQLYEFFFALLGLWIFRPANVRWQSAPPGVYCLAFAAFSAGGRLFLEAFRGDSRLLIGGIRAAQAAAWMVLAGCLWGYHRLQNRDRDAA